MLSINLPHDAWILVGDGRKALILQNEGDARFPNLKTTQVVGGDKVPSTADLGTDKPGRAINSRDGRRSGVKQTDWHEQAELRFADDVAKRLEAHNATGDFDALVVVAPPKTLAELRRTFSDGLRSKIIAEVDKDLTKHPVYEIERLLFGVDKGKPQ